MQTIAAFILIIFIHTSVYCQYDTIPNGAYRNIVDFHSSNPFDTSDFMLKQKKKKGTVFYKVKSPDYSVPVKTIRHAIYLLKTDSALYLNSARLGMTNWYIKLDSVLPYTYFRGIPIVSGTQKAEVANSAFWFGVPGALAAASSVTQDNEGQVHYVLNMETGMVNLFTSSYLLMVLESKESYTEILKQYKNEQDPESIGPLLKYLRMINQNILLNDDY